MDQGNQSPSRAASDSEQDRRPVLSRQVRFADEANEWANPPAVVGDGDDDDAIVASRRYLSSLRSELFGGDAAQHPSSPAAAADDDDAIMAGRRYLSTRWSELSGGDATQHSSSPAAADDDDDDYDDDDMTALMCAHLEKAQAAIDRGDMEACHDHRRMAWWYLRTFEECGQSVVPCPVPGCDWKFPNLCGAPKPQQRHFLACHMPLTPEDLAELARAPPSLQSKPQWARAKVAGWSLYLHDADIPFLRRLFPADMESELLEWTPFQEA